MPFDFQELVQALSQNGQRTLPPNDVQRMGVVAGFDPQWYDGDGNTYPALSVYVAGDTVPTHGCRFSSSLTPHLGDTVFLIQTGNDVLVTSSLSGNIKAATQSALGGSISVVAHATFSIEKTIPYSSAISKIQKTDLVAPILPNRLYKAEVTATYTPQNTLTYLYVYTPVNGYVGVGSSPDQGEVTVSGSVISSDVPPKPLLAGQWKTKYPDNKFTWHLGIKMNEYSAIFSGTNNIQLTIYDMGPTS